MNEYVVEKETKKENEIYNNEFIFFYFLKTIQN